MLSGAGFPTSTKGLRACGFEFPGFGLGFFGRGRLKLLFGIKVLLFRVFGVGFMVKGWFLGLTNYGSQWGPLN